MSFVYWPVYAYARGMVRSMYRALDNLEQVQRRTLASILAHNADTAFGRDHDFRSIRSYEEFVQAVPMRDYEKLREDYLERIWTGESDVTMPGIPPWMLKTGGSTAGTKYLPFSKRGLRGHQAGGALTFFSAMIRLGNPAMFAGRTLMIGDWNDMEPHACGSIITQIGGLAPASVPRWFENRKMSPTREVNAIESYDERIEIMAETSMKQDIRYASGLTSWTLMVFERIASKLGLKPGEALTDHIWPNLKVSVNVGMNFAPYEGQFRSFLGPKVKFQEVFAATEGFFAFQDRFGEPGLLLIPNTGYFHEFVRMDEFGKDDARRVPYWDIEPGVDYAMVLTSWNGQYAYVHGDTIRFVDRHRCVVTGRTGWALSTVGEHLITENLEKAVGRVTEETGIRISEYTMGPIWHEDDRQTMPQHEWIIEVPELPSAEAAADWLKRTDQALQDFNSNYLLFRENKGLGFPIAHFVAPGTFQKWLRKKAEEGGRVVSMQAKIPRLRPDRSVLDSVMPLIDEKVSTG